MRGRANGRRAMAPGPLPVDGGAATAPPATGTPFDHRVRVLVEIRDDPDEIALAQEVVGGFGWPMRAPRAGEGPAGGVAASHVARVVEVRLLGARRGIAAQAAHELDRLARGTGLSLVVREAALIRRAEEPGQEWEVVPVAVSPRERVRAFFAGGDKDDRPEHVICVPAGSSSPTPDIASLSTALDPQPFVAAEYRLRRLTFRPSMAALLVVGLGLLGTVGLGSLIHVTDLTPGTARSLIRPLALALCLTLACSVGSFGLAHAVRYSTALRLALPWTLPLALPVLLAGVPRVGGVVQDRYLAHFDLPGDPVTTGWWDSLRAGVFTCLCALAGFLLLVGTAGFVHRLGARAGAPFSHSLLLGALYGTVAALLLSVVAVGRVDVVAADDRHALAEGRTPDGLYGLEPEFVCVRPTTRTPPVYGTLPPATRPVVTFGPSGDRVSLWDPETGQSLSMRLEDAVFVPAGTQKGRSVCPQAR
ncbi:hypothetical protein ACIBBD_32140 [Streptomyces sp. NPDC051315]|uniref:hypothetical protein n=1 Tax=Streptomyces sp. NPDC051315 TaxID=3365650 RepID=UPI00379F09C5